MSATPSFPLKSIFLPHNASKSLFFDYFCRFCTIPEDIFLPHSVKKQLTTAIFPFTLRLTILCRILVKNKEEHAHAKPSGSFSGLFLYACSRLFSGVDAFLLCGNGCTTGRRKHDNTHKAAHQYWDWHRGGASGGGITETKPAPPEPAPEEPKPEEPKDEKPTETPKEENKEKPKEELKEDPAPAASPAIWSADGTTLTGYTFPKDFNGVLELPKEKSYKIAPSAFENCLNIKEVLIPRNVTELGHNAFFNCRNLEKVTIQAPITVLPSAIFKDCWNLQSISLPDTIQFIGDSAFRSCGNLTHINYPKELTRIGTFAFFETGLTEVLIPDTVTRIENSAFASCRNATKLRLPLNLRTIEEDSFSGVGPESIPSIDLIIPDGVLAIDKYAFAGSSIRLLYIPSSVSTVSESAFTGVFFESIQYDGDSAGWEHLAAQSEDLDAYSDLVEYVKSPTSLLSNLLSIF